MHLVCRKTYWTLLPESNPFTVHNISSVGIIATAPRVGGRVGGRKRDQTACSNGTSTPTHYTPPIAHILGTNKTAQERSKTHFRPPTEQLPGPIWLQQAQSMSVTQESQPKTENNDNTFAGNSDTFFDQAQVLLR